RSCNFAIWEGFKDVIDTNITKHWFASTPARKPYCYQLSKAEAQEQPLPKAARHTRSPSLSFLCSQASLKAIGIVTAVVLPEYMMLLNTFSSGNSSFSCTNLLILRFAWGGTNRSISRGVF